jgi:hypothetical protein
MSICWKGRVENHLDGIGRQREVGLSIYLLCVISMSIAIVMVVVGRSFSAIVLGWVPVIAYLLVCGTWAFRREDYTGGINVVLDDVWSRYWIEEGHLEKAIDHQLAKRMIPYYRSSRWSYLHFYELPGRVRIGVGRLFVSRGRMMLFIHIEGVDRGNLDIALEVQDIIDGLSIEGCPGFARVVRTPHCSRALSRC